MLGSRKMNKRRIHLPIVEGLLSGLRSASSVTSNLLVCWSSAVSADAELLVFLCLLLVIICRRDLLTCVWVSCIYITCIMPTQAVYAQPVFLYTGAVNQCIGCIGCIGPQITPSCAYPVQIAMTLNPGSNPNPNHNPNPTRAQS